MGKRIPLILGLIILFLAIWVQITPSEFFHLFIVRLNNVAYDMQLRTELFAHSRKPAAPIAIVDIDDKSLHSVGRWPWPRNQIAELVQHLKEQGAVVIALDTLFSEPETDIADTILQELKNHKLNTPAFTSALNILKPELNADNILGKTLQNKDIVLGFSFIPRTETEGQLPETLLTLKGDEKNLEFISWKGYISNVPIIQASAKNGGFINVIPDQDGIIRRVPLVMRYQDNLYGSLALEAVKVFLLSEVKLITANYNKESELEGIQLSSHTIPTDATAQILVPFIGKSYTFPYFSAIDVLNNTLPPNALSGKIVFVGTSATGLGDLRATAIESVYPGVEVQATIANAILTDHYSYRPEWTVGAEVAITFILGLILTITFPYLGPRSLALCGIGIPVALIFINNRIWESTGLVIFILIPIILTIVLVLINIIYGYLFETLKRERIKSMFGQYVPEKHIDEMLQAKSDFGLHGDDREMTVLFADIRNFTAISEDMTAADLKDLLNEFFTPMTEIIFKHKGTIDKYIGDLIMAFWGAPLKDKRHAQHALSTALDMQKAVEKLKLVFAEKNRAEINIGIGVNTGVMSVGDMGSKFRRNYTVLGDSVNLGSRIEGLTKFYGVKIITTDTTLANNRSLFVVRQLDRVRVKGKNMGVTIYEVIAHTSEATRALHDEVALSDNALNFYFQQQWDAAEKIFTDLHNAHPDVKLYEIYIRRITECKLNPPAADWDGIYAHANK